jgi:hypothetical protein
MKALMVLANLLDWLTFHKVPPLCNYAWDLELQYGPGPTNQKGSAR